MTRMSRQVVMKVVGRAFGSGGWGAVTLEVAAQKGCLAAKTVDSEDEIQESTNQRHQPNETDPRDSRAGIPLVQNGVSGGEKR
jgi:hypothetical protein